MSQPGPDASVQQAADAAAAGLVLLVEVLVLTDDGAPGEIT